MNKKFNKELLSEELKKFKLLSEYSFYTGDDAEKLILGDEISEAEDEESEEPVEDAADNVADELGVSDDMEGGEELEGGEEPIEEPVDNEEMAPEMELEPEAEPTPEMTGEGEVEIDVTELVNGTEEVKQSSDETNAKMDALLGKFGELESRLSNMDKISTKIDGLEKELEKRVPTPQEKLEMRSLNSYPYSLKLTDYWSEKEGTYDVMNNGENKKEFTLTQDEVDTTYSEGSIKSSFDDFEEEDI